MVRSLAVGFGMLTALAVAGSMTPTGQGVLGQRHSPEHVANVSSIQDRPVAIPGPAQSLVAAPVAPKAAPAPVATRVVSPAPQRPQAAPAPRPRASQPPQAQNGPGGMAGIANILLNLPQVLDQTHVGPSGGPDSWSQSRPAPADPGQGKPHKKHRWGPEAPQHKEQGDDNN